MRHITSLYVPGNTVIHRADARAKVLLLLAFSLALVAVRSWWGMGVCALVVVVATLVARIPVRQIAVASVPVLVLALFSFAMHVVAEPNLDGVLAGGFFALRMLLLVAASFVVCFTTTVEELLGGFRSLLGPLRAVHVPVDDIAFTLALSVRFIPVIAEEFGWIRAAQVSRGGDAANLPFTRAVRVWGAAFSSVFVGMFRHADTLATAMDARCYGAQPVRSALNVRPWRPAGTFLLVAGCALCLVVGVFL